MEINPLKKLYSDIINIIKTVEIKYKAEADKCETLDMTRSADEYIRAMLKEDTFNSYYEYDEDAIRIALNLGVNDDINVYQLNRDEIPYDKRDELLNQQRICVKNKYIERNNYYRKLNGLPNIEDGESDFVYIEKNIAIDQKIPDNIPIHELNDYQILALDQIGYIDKLVSENPDKKYLNFLGNKKIDIITSRKARNFAILNQPEGVPESILNNFSLIYEQCREYFMVCIYITEYRNTIDFYDNFIAMCIMVMAIQQILARVIKNTIERDFFDDHMCQILFDVYGVPYNPNMDSSIRSQLVKNLNMLVKNKGTNQVIYDIASILGYNRLQIFKYYLVKSQKFDSNGLPIQSTIKDLETGENVLDYKNMYDIYIQKIPIEDDDVYDNIINVNDKFTYEEIAGNDPYWWHDEEVEKILYESEYNYIETKYMGVGITYRMTRVLFENIYLLKLLFDEKDKMTHVILDLPKISADTKMTLFDTVVLMCALTCKQNKLNGEILIDTSKILHVNGFKRDDFDTIADSFSDELYFYDGNIMGFNSGYTVEELHNEIKNNPYLDDTLCKFFTNATSYNADGINNLYKNYEQLYNELVKKMSSTNDKNVYQAYKKFYQAFFYTKENRRMFNVGTSDNPEYPTTFMEYIRKIYPDIYEYVENESEANLHELTTYLVSRLSGSISDLQTIGFFNEHSSIIETMLLELLRFFKSYTTDLLNLDTIYIFDLKPDSIIRLIDNIAGLSTKIIPKDSLNISYSDNIHTTSVIKQKSDLVINEKVIAMHKLDMLYDNIKFMNQIKKMSTCMTPKDSTLTYTDIVNTIESFLEADITLKFADTCVIKKHV